MLQPFQAAYYSAKHRARLADLTVSDLDTAEHLWGGPDYSRAFRNVLVGFPEQRGEAWQAWISGGDIELSDEQAFYALHQRQEVEGQAQTNQGKVAARCRSCPGRGASYHLVG